MRSERAVPHTAMQLIVADLDFHLLTYHAYRPLLLFATDSKMPKCLVRVGAAARESHATQLHTAACVRRHAGLLLTTCTAAKWCYSSHLMCLLWAASPMRGRTALRSRRWP